MSTEMKINAIAPWFGSKRTMAAAIVEQLGRHVCYFEPFAGSMAVLLAKDKSRYETVNDRHGWLTNLARVLTDERAAVKLYDRLVRTLFCETTLRESEAWLAAEREPDPAVIDVDGAYHLFVHSWAGRNGCAGQAKMNFQLAVRWTPTGGSATTRFRSAIDSIPAWHDRLRNVVILTRDAFGVLASMPDSHDVAIYCDPPYLVSSRTGKGNGGGYLHDFTEEAGDTLFGARDDHSRLAEALGRFKHARVVVSYYAAERLKQLYPLSRWTHVAVAAPKLLANAGSREMDRGRTDAPEVLIINGASYAKGTP